jgi:hypothetical protein
LGFFPEGIGSLSQFLNAIQQDGFDLKTLITNLEQGAQGKEVLS